MQPITVSIVIYKNEYNQLLTLLETLASAKRAGQVAAWIVIDNSDAQDIKAAVQTMGGLYICTGENVGYGRGHNQALKHLSGVTTRYHLILNPDITFHAEAIGSMADIMDVNPDVGLLMPKVLYPDGSNQYLCKLLPTPIDLVLRRFAPGIIKTLAHNRIAAYELRNFDYENSAYVPSLSGCFMFTRRCILDAIGGFDERFFLYMEDIDLCRRIAVTSKLLYWPEITVRHEHQMGSYKRFRILMLHIRSAISYFNKWGWIIDSNRKKTNNESLILLREKGYKV